MQRSKNKGEQFSSRNDKKMERWGTEEKQIPYIWGNAASFFLWIDSFWEHVGPSKRIMSAGEVKSLVSDCYRRSDSFGAWANPKVIKALRRRSIIFFQLQYLCSRLYWIFKVAVYQPRYSKDYPGIIICCNQQFFAHPTDLYSAISDKKQSVVSSYQKEQGKVTGDC